MTKVFIDGSAGTTGLRIADRLKKRADLELICLPEEIRKDYQARKDAVNGADIVFLCLPDAAAIEAVGMVENDTVKVIDTSTAHRVNDGWTYGFAEIVGSDKIASSRFVANPGCHASGFIALVAPLVKAGLLNKDALLSCFSLTGYTGGGKKMIADYEGAKGALDAPRQYALTQQHKHLKEMVAVTGIERAPVFLPVVGAFPRGMQVSVPLSPDWLSCDAKGVKEIYRSLYQGGVVRYEETETPMLAADVMAGKDVMTVSVIGNEERIVAVASFDNLGKGASGAAIQNLNLMLGADELTGLKTE